MSADQLLPMGLLLVLVVFMYFFMIRPQKKQERETAAMRSSLRIGDEITTIGGIIGKIVSIKEPTCLIETGRDGTKIRILISAVKNVDVPAAVVGTPMVTTPDDAEKLPEANESRETLVNGEPEKKSKKKK